MTDELIRSINERLRRKAVNRGQLETDKKMIDQQISIVLNEMMLRQLKGDFNCLKLERTLEDLESLSTVLEEELEEPDIEEDLDAPALLESLKITDTSYKNNFVSGVSDIKAYKDNFYYLILSEGALKGIYDYIYKRVFFDSTPLINQCKTIYDRYLAFESLFPPVWDRGFEQIEADDIENLKERFTKDPSCGLAYAIYTADPFLFHTWITGWFQQAQGGSQFYLSMYALMWATIGDDIDREQLTKWCTKIPRKIHYAFNHYSKKLKFALTDEE